MGEFEKNWQRKEAGQSVNFLISIISPGAILLRDFLVLSKRNAKKEKIS